MDQLRRAVGPGMPNDSNDVRLIDAWLYRWEFALGQPSGLLFHQPVLARQQQNQRIESFQRSILGDPCPSGIVKPGDRTARKLEELPKTAPKHLPLRPVRGALLNNAPAGTPLRLPPRIGATTLTDDDYAAAAKEIGCDLLAIKAVSLEEGKGQGFDAMGYPVILFEPLNFASLAGPKGHPHFGQVYRKKYPDLTHRHPLPHPYGPTKQIWQRLQMAYLLDPLDALRATSWGRFQVKGDSATRIGYCSVENFVSAMCRSEKDHLQAFVGFIRFWNLASALQRRDWPKFAFKYNGAGYKQPQYLVGGKDYAERIGDCYEKLKAQSK